METKTIDAVAKVLSDWNPLGAADSQYPDLDGYRTEAIDIISALYVLSHRRNTQKVVLDVLNEAFGLSLTAQDCAAPAAKISEIVNAE